MIDPNWLEEESDVTGPPLTDEMIHQAETTLGYKLPAAYLELLLTRNGGSPKANRYPTSAPTGWAEDHVEVAFIYGIGGESGIDTETGSRYFVSEWGYPESGIVIGHTPSAGPEALMLDYRQCGPDGEPQVIYVDIESDESYPAIQVLAPNFEVFLESFTINTEDD